MYECVKMQPHIVRETDSTNSCLKRLADCGKLTPGFSLLAEVQTAGRGRGSRVWRSEKNAGMTASYWIDAGACLLKAEQLAALPLVSGLAVVRALDRLYGLHGGAENRSPVSLKWPNDIWASGGKLGGILCELISGGGVFGVVSGIGLNLRSSSFDAKLRGRAVSFEEAAGQILKPEEVFEAVGERLFELCSELSASGFAGLASEWYGRCLHRDKFIKVNVKLEASENDGRAGHLDFGSRELAEVMERWQSGEKFCFSDQNTVYGFTKGIAENGGLLLQVPEWREDGSHAFSERLITMGDVSVNLQLSSV